MKRFFFVFLLLCFTAITNAQDQTHMYAAYDSETVTVSTVAVTFTASKLNPTPNPTALRADLATFTIECASASPCPIRILTTGTAPTSSVGLGPYDAGVTISVYGIDNTTNFKAIRSGSNDAKIQVQYLKKK